MRLSQKVLNAIGRAVTTITPDVEEALKKALKKESRALARLQLQTILKNVELARKNKTPVCQDTGTPLFFVKLERNCNPGMIERELKQAVRLATNKGLLRPNMVDPLSRKNTGDNTGEGAPAIHFQKSRGKLRIIFVAKGAGSENCSALEMLDPSQGEAGIRQFVLKHVVSIGGKPCPPFVLGIGIGGTSEECMLLSKKASLRRIGSRNKNPRLAALEKRLEREVNSLGIGPMGLGGDTTVLAVNAESAECHTGSLPVALNVLCWAKRVSEVKI